MFVGCCQGGGSPTYTGHGQGGSPVWGGCHGDGDGITGHTGSGGWMVTWTAVHEHCATHGAFTLRHLGHTHPSLISGPLL